MNPKRRAVSLAGSLLEDRNRQARAALAAAIGEHFLATSGRHASAESVGAKAAKVMGLVGALHGSGFLSTLL